MFTNQPALTGRNRNFMGFDSMPFSGQNYTMNDMSRFGSMDGSNSPYWGFSSPSTMEEAFFHNEYTAKTDIIETKDSYQFYVEVPGFSSENVYVSLEGSVLTIKGYRTSENERPTSKSNVEHHVICNERSARSFVRQFHLSDMISEKGVTATLKNGLLSIVVKKGTNKGAIKVDVCSA